MRQLIYATAFLVFASEALHGQFYAITGSAHGGAIEGRPFSIYSIAPNSEPQEVSSIYPGSAAADWVGYSPDWGVIAVTSWEPTSPGQVFVADLQKGFAEKRCAKPTPRPGHTAVAHWLIDVPGIGNSLVELFFSGDSASGPFSAYLTGINLDTTVPCEKSFFSGDPSDLRYVKASGWAGISTLIPRNEIDQVAVARDGKLSVFLPGIGRYYFDWQLPTDVVRGMAHPDAVININNNSIMAVSLGDYDNASTYRLLVQRKSDQTWHAVPQQLGDPHHCCRGFGPFIGITELKPKKTSKLQNAGAEEWRPEPFVAGLSMKELLDQDLYVYPGRLHIYDAETEKIYTIETKQADSEILLIQDRTVYFRVSDQLFSAPILDDGLGPWRLLSRSDIVRDVHWAYVKQ